MSITYIITFDINSGWERKSKLTKLIRDFDSWAMLGEGSYIVISDADSTELRDHFSEHLREGDHLFVGTLSAPAAWINLGDEVSAWLRNNL